MTAAFATLVVTIIGAAVGALLGVVSWHFWVLGLAGLTLGVTVGWTLAVVRAWLALKLNLAPIAILAIISGWALLQVFEDGHQRDAYRLALARVNAASTGLPPAEVQRQLDADNLAFWAQDSDADLERQVVAEIGFGGLAGRWLFRAEGGIRLAGGARSSRGLPIGIPGAIIAAILELALATFIALRITKRSVSSRAA